MGTMKCSTSLISTVSPGAFLLSVQRIKLPDAHVIDKGSWEPMSYSVHGLDAVGLGDSIMEFVHVLFKRFNT